jgi:hypothetical protein
VVRAQSAIQADVDRVVELLNADADHDALVLADSLFEKHPDMDRDTRASLMTVQRALAERIAAGRPGADA